MVMTSSESAATVVAVLKSIVECLAMNDFSYFKLKCNQIDAAVLTESINLTLFVLAFWDMFPISMNYRRKHLQYYYILVGYIRILNCCIFVFVATKK
jgi:hypothetical protein